jgi:tyrosyl-DNA phosphodiesterase 2
MGRDALYVDLEFPDHAPASNTRTSKIVVRIANTHLESLRGHGDRARPIQLGSIAKLLACSDVRGGLVGGDMNAISPSDIDLPRQVGLSDSWDGLAPTRGAQLDISGHTWGYQPHSIYPPNRLDKILLRGDLRVQEIKKVGVGLKVTGLNVWVSDHYGLLARVVIETPSSINIGQS